MPDNSQKVPAFIFFLGVSPSERGSDPRGESLVNALARLGVAVMVPWLETQEKEIVVKDDIGSLVYLFEYLSNMEEIDDMLDRWIHNSVVRAQLRELIVNAIRTHSIQTLKDNKDEY